MLLLLCIAGQACCLSFSCKTQKAKSNNHSLNSNRCKESKNFKSFNTFRCQIKTDQKFQQPRIQEESLKVQLQLSICKEEFLLPFYVRKSIVHTFGQFFSSGFDPLRNLIRVFLSRYLIGNLFVQLHLSLSEYKFQPEIVLTV